MAHGNRSMTQISGGSVQIAQCRSIGAHARARVWRVALAAALTLLLMAGQRPTGVLRAAAASAGTSVAALHLYWTNDGGTTVGRANLDGTQVNNKFVVGAVNPERLCGVAIAGKYLYWGIDSQQGSNSVGRAKLDGTSVNQAFINNTSSPVCGVAVAGGYLYWASYGQGSIGRAKLDGTSVTTIISGMSATNTFPFDCGHCSPQGIAVYGAHVYWAAGGSIGRANLDGTGENDNFITGLDTAGGVTVTSKYIYWTDAGVNTLKSALGRARLDGTAVQRGFIKGLNGASGLAVTDRYIYWAENGFTGKGTTIERAKLDGTGVQPRFITGLQAPNQVTVGP